MNAGILVGTMCKLGKGISSIFFVEDVLTLILDSFLQDVPLLLP